MKPSEFYTKYCKITMPDGTVASPPPLSEKECFYMDEVWNNPRLKGIYYGRRRNRSIAVNVEQMKEDMSKLPYFLTNYNPTLNKQH